MEILIDYLKNLFFLLLFYFHIMTVLNLKDLNLILKGII
jgi:hypothetical protein